MQSAARSYFQTQVTTTTQGDLVVMLFDAALKFLHQAKEKMLEKNYAQKGVLISRALDILTELQGSLNVKKGGDLADRLLKLYFYCSATLLTANLKMDTAKVDEVVHILDGLRDAFSQANEQVTTKAVPVSATQTAPRALANTPPAPILLPKPHFQAGDGPDLASAAAANVAAQQWEDPSRVAQSQSPAPAPVAPVTVTPTATPVRRIMAAYAASRTSAA
jgi:flagellar secretion chaperone FliS